MAEGHVGHSHHVVGNGLVRLAGCCGDWLRCRVLRGGSFGSYRGGVRCAYRFYFDPDDRGYDVGFRVVGPHGFHRCPVSRMGSAGLLRRLRLAQRGGRPVQPIPGRVRAKNWANTPAF